jgi:hypothetical protein
MEWLNSWAYVQEAAVIARARSDWSNLPVALLSPRGTRRSPIGRDCFACWLAMTVLVRRWERSQSGSIHTITSCISKTLFAYNFGTLAANVAVPILAKNGKGNMLPRRLRRIELPSLMLGCAPSGRRNPSVGDYPSRLDRCNP